MKIAERRNRIGYIVVMAALAAVTALYKLVITGVNSTTVALSLLLVVLVAASAYGLGQAILASALGMFCFNFFFLPPFYTLTVHDPQNWVALSAFLVTAIIASQISAAARARAQEAERRREEVWKLYQLSRDIIVTPDWETTISSITRRVVEIFGLECCLVAAPGEAGRFVYLARATGHPEGRSLEPAPQLIDEAFNRGEPIEQFELRANRKGGEEQGVTYVPLKVGVRPIGVMALRSRPIERATLEAIAGLVALALERARFLKEASQTEALRQSDQLKSALLASVSHDLRTPLTSIRAAIDNLLQKDVEWERAALDEFHQIISEEVSRLTRLVESLLEMARIQAGELHLSKQWSTVSEIFSNALERCAPSTRNHRITTAGEENLPLVRVDSRSLAEALINLVENAANYSPDGSEIKIAAALRQGELHISVADQGAGVAPEDRERIFDKFYRSPRQIEQRREGTGMGLAIARGIVEAHGGRIWVESTPGQGAVFTFAVPAECRDTQQPVQAIDEL